METILRATRKKYASTILSVTIMMLGLGILGLGIYMGMNDERGNFQFQGTLLPYSIAALANRHIVRDRSMVTMLSYGVLSLSVFIVVLGFASFHVDQYMLGLIYILLFLIAGALFAIGVHMYKDRNRNDPDINKLFKLVRSTLRQAVDTANNEDSRIFLDAVEKKFNCCGSDNGHDGFSGYITVSCTENNTRTPCFSPFYKYIQTERAVTSKYFKDKMTFIMIMDFIFTGILGIAVILTIALFCTTAKEQQPIVKRF